MRLTDPAESLMPMGTVPATAIPTAEFSQPMRPTLVMGVGNVLQGDDGVGVHAIHQLERHLDAWPGLRLYDAGTLGTTLLVEIEQAQCLAFIDAMRMDATAGTVCCFEDQDMDRWM